MKRLPETKTWRTRRKRQKTDNEEADQDDDDVDNDEDQVQDDAYGLYDEYDDDGGGDGDQGGGYENEWGYEPFEMWMDRNYGEGRVADDRAAGRAGCCWEERGRGALLQADVYVQALQAEARVAELLACPCAQRCGRGSASKQGVVVNNTICVGGTLAASMSKPQESSVMFMHVGQAGLMCNNLARIAGNVAVRLKHVHTYDCVSHIVNA